MSRSQIRIGSSRSDSGPVDVGFRSTRTGTIQQWFGDTRPCRQTCRITSVDEGDERRMYEHDHGYEDDPNCDDIHDDNR